LVSVITCCGRDAGLAPILRETSSYRRETQQR
jgi:hypothetical protein